LTRTVGRGLNGWLIRCRGASPAGSLLRGGEVVAAHPDGQLVAGDPLVDGRRDRVHARRRRLGGEGVAVAGDGDGDGDKELSHPGGLGHRETW
jgi:hypothetical protein